MVYATIADLDDYGTSNPKGSIRFVCMGEISKPTDVRDVTQTYYHGEHYFSNYEDAKAYFELEKKSWASSGFDYSGIEFSDET